ncbi:hypothetical protein HDE_07749 [Halotydeus destructor]|nr:hypothetical protein HDE_07749 [Halotydeus destructor]
MFKVKVDYCPCCLVSKWTLVALLCLSLMLSLFSGVTGVELIDATQKHETWAVEFFVVTLICDDMATMTGLYGVLKDNYWLIMGFSIVKTALLMISLFSFTYYGRIQHAFYLLEWISAALAFGVAVYVRKSDTDYLNYASAASSAFEL